MLEIQGRQIPTELREIVAPRRSALLIVDMQNDFCAPGGSVHVQGADLAMYSEIVPRIATLVAAARTARLPVIFVRMVSLPDGGSDSVAWIRMRLRATKPTSTDGGPAPPWSFTAEGTWGAEFLPELRPLASDPVVTKMRSSAFHNTNLETILRAQNAGTVIVTGCTTEGCVESTVRDASFHDYIPVVVSDCVGSDDRRLHDASMTVMSAYRADVATSEEIQKAWTDSGAGATTLGG